MNVISTLRKGVTQIRLVRLCIVFKSPSHPKCGTFCSKVFKRLGVELIGGQKLKSQNVSLTDKDETPRLMPEVSDSYVTNPNEEGSKMTPPSEGDFEGTNEVSRPAHSNQS